MQQQQQYQVVYPTLAELQAMTAQDIFSRAAEHLLRQGVKSKVPNVGTCLYRGPNGTACAVGALIPQDLYEEGLEGDNVNTLVDSDEVPTSLRNIFGAHKWLLKSLQASHDHNSVENWPRSLAQVAESYGLQMIPLNGLAVIPMGMSGATQ